LIAAQRGVAAKPAEPEDLISVLSDRINILGDEVLAGAAVLVDAPLLLAWVKGQIANEYTRALWIQVAYSLVIVFGTGLVAEWAARRLLARVMPRAPAPTRKRLAVRLLLIGGALMIEALPVAVFAGTAIAALALTIPPFAMARYALSDLIEATIAVRLIIAVARAVLVPAYADDNLIPASEETRNYLLIWVRRFACWGIFGYALAAATWWLGVPGGIYALLLKINALVLAILGVVFILQNRASRLDRGFGYGGIRWPEPGAPSPRRDLAYSGDRVYRRDLSGIRAASRGRLRLYPTRDVGQPRGDRRRQIAGSLH
jgi:moderate conductance mechanosensitive channel